MRLNNYDKNKIREIRLVKVEAAAKETASSKSASGVNEKKTAGDHKEGEAKE